MLSGIINLPKPSSSSLPTGDIWYAAAPIALLMFASLIYSISSKNKNKKVLNIHVSPETTKPPTGLFPRFDDDDQLSWKSASDVILQEDNDDEMVTKDDAKYAESLQIQEALLASMLNPQETPNNPSSSSRKSLASLLNIKETEISNIPPLKICKICFENQESIKNPTCSHSFCYECITKHATTKIQEKNTTINCPGLNCKFTLDFNFMRLIIPEETLIKWDELLCESMILESQKLYCPFANCSVLLINDDVSITNIDCPVCKRAFCAVCRVPWHSEFSCKEFEKLNKKKGKKGDEMVVALAQKKNWKKCPNCKFFVEKTDGCLHITCRCKYEFCYNCRSKWSSNHGGCKSRS